MTRQQICDRDRYQQDKLLYASVLIRVPREDYARIKQVAQSAGMSIKEFVASAIEWGLENVDRRVQPQR